MILREEAQNRQPISGTAAEKRRKELTGLTPFIRNMPGFTQPVSGPEPLTSFAKKFSAEVSCTEKHAKELFDLEAEQREWNKWRNFPKIQAGIMDYKFRFPGYKPPRLIDPPIPKVEGQAKPGRKKKDKPERTYPPSPREPVNSPIDGGTLTGCARVCTYNQSLKDAPNQGRKVHPVVARHHPAYGHMSTQVSTVQNPKGKNVPQPLSPNPTGSGRQSRGPTPERTDPCGEVPQDHMSE